MTDLEKEIEILRQQNEELKKENGYLNDQLNEIERPRTRVVYKECEPNEVK